VALASRQHQAAVTMAEAAVSAAPEMGAAWVALGQAHKFSGQAEEAERAYRRAVRLDGMNALARIGLGELMIASRRPEEAVVEYDLALRRQPALVAAHMGWAMRWPRRAERGRSGALPAGARAASATG